MNGLGFISPALFGLGALSIPIFLLYMLRLRRTEVPISSSFLWQQLVRDREANAPWQRLRPSWLLLLQLLILAALVIALARPFTEVRTITTGRTVILLDASASMSSTDMGDDESRFEAAQQLALDTVDTLGSEDTMTVIRVAENPEVLIAASRDKGLLRKAIRDAKSGNGNADWLAAFTLAVAGGEGVDTLSVVALSDGGVPSNLPEIPGTFRYVKIGEKSDNVAISALATRALPNENPQVFAQLSNFGITDTSVIFSIETDGELRTANRYDIPAGQRQDVIIEGLPDNFTTLKASLSAPRNVNTPNYLALDDTAYSIFQVGGSGNVLVVTEGNIFLERLFASLPGVTLTMRTPDEGLPSGDYDLYVFDGWLPDSLSDDTDLLLVNPPESTRMFTLLGETTDTKINPDTGGINPEDDRTRYLDFRNVNISKMQVLQDTEEWATPIVQTESGGNVIIAGEFEGQQVAVISFDFHNSDFPLQIAYPILINNLLSWYQPQRALQVGDSIPSGTPVTVRPSVEADYVKITLPDGNSVELELVDSPEVIFADTKQIGLYKVEVRRGDRAVQTEAFAVNLFDPFESNIIPQDDLVIATSEGQQIFQSSRGEELGHREWWNYLAGLGLILLLLEWWYYHYSRNRVRTATAKMSFGDASPQSKSRSRRRWLRMGN